MTTKQEIALIEKIARAKMKLESTSVNHKDSCPVECDPEGYAPCNCGATKTNYAIEAAIRELSFDD